MGTPGKHLVEASSDVSLHDGEERQTIFVYKKLVVPMNMRSIFWKFYGFPANDEGEILTKVKIVCILCKTVIAYNGNTSNLKVHLKSKHPHELDAIELQTPSKKSPNETKEKKRVKRMKPVSSNDVSFIYTGDSSLQLEKDVHIVSDPNISLDELNTASTVKVLMKTESQDSNDQNVTAFLMDDNDQNAVDATAELDLPDQSDQSMFEKNNISDAIAQFVVSDLQSPDVVETPGFQRLVATLKSPCEIPSKLKLVEDVIPKLYETFRDSVLDNLNAAISDIALSVEEWKSDNCQTNVTVSAHFQQHGFEDQLQSKVLSTVHCSLLFNSEHWSQLIESILSEWRIPRNRIKAVIVATNQETLLESLRLQNYTLVPCLTFTLQNVCMNGCFKLPEVTKVINKVRMFMTLVYRNTTALSTLRFHEHVSQIEEVTLSMDYPNIWISTYMMLEQLLVRRGIIKSVIEVIGNTPYDKDTIDLSDDEWTIIEDIVTVLEPFKVTTMTLAEEKSPLVSLVKPLLWQLISVHLKVQDDNDSVLSKRLKEGMSSLLKETYSHKSVDTMLNIATTLDPRFKSLPYSIEDSKAMLKGPIKEQLNELIKTSDSTPKQSGNSTGSSSAKKARLSGMEFLLGNVCSTSHSITATERAELEINQYTSEPTANLDHCPLQWWQKSTDKFSNLAKVSYKYSCIPASAIPPSRIPVESQISHELKRGKVFPELIDKLIFLNANRSHYV